MIMVARQPRRLRKKPSAAMVAISAICPMLIAVEIQFSGNPIFS